MQIVTTSKPTISLKFSTCCYWIQVNYTEYEYCEILQGVIVMTEDGGEAQTVRAGDRFTLEPGYRGTWEVREYARKVYVIYEP